LSIAIDVVLAPHVAEFNLKYPLPGSVLVSVFVENLHIARLPSTPSAPLVPEDPSPPAAPPKFTSHTA